MTENRRLQRKRIFTAHVTARRKQMVLPLSEELRKQRNISRVPVRKGDTVVVVKGDSDIRGLEGKVSKVDTRRRKVLVDGITIAKADGKQAARPLSYSNLMIIALAVDQKRNISREES